MARRIRFVLIACSSFQFAPISAAEVTSYALLTTDYVYRGVSLSDEHGAVQFGVDVGFESGVYFGVWGSTVDIGGGTSRQRDREVNYYLGYAYDISQKWTIGANAVAYSYPGGKGQIDYDYVEYSLIANFDDHVWAEYNYSADIYHTGETTQNISLYMAWPLENQFSIGAGAGYYDVSNLIGDGYSYWELGVTRPFRFLLLDLRYHDTSRWVPIISSPQRADTRLVLSARFQF